MVKKISLLFFCAVACFSSTAQFPAVVDSVYTFIKYNSVFRNKVDWQQADKEFYNCIRSGKTIDDTMNCFVDVLKRLDDVHTQISFNSRYYGYYHPVDDSTFRQMKPLREKAQAAAGKIQTTILQNKFAYVLVPAINAYGKDQVNVYAQQLHETICRLGTKDIRGFIIDLRLNSGGNMYPMLTGLGALLGNTVIGYETDIDNNIVRKWEIKDGNFVIGGYRATSVTKICDPGYEQMPVAVLTGPCTASSGTMTAIAFRKRPNTIFIGEPTADGYSTSNGYFRFAPNLVFNFASSFVADREKNVYKTTVAPDIVIKASDNFDDLEQDNKVQAALRWLKEKR